MKHLQNMAESENKELETLFNSEENKCNEPTENVLYNASDCSISKIVHIDEELGSNEINIPLRNIELTENSNNNTVNFENINSMNDFIIPNDSNDDIPVNFDIDLKDNLNKDTENVKNENVNTNTTSNTPEQNTLSCIEVFDEICKKYEHNDTNTYNVLNSRTILTTSLSETEELLKSLNDNKNIEISLKNDDIALPILSNSEACVVINDIEVVRNPLKHDHTYVTISRDNSTQLSSSIDKDENVPTKDSFTISDPSNSAKIEFESNDTVINNYLNVVNDNKDSPIDDKVSIISISSESIGSDLELLTSDFHIIDHLDINNDVISLSSTDNDTINDKNDSDCEGYNSSDFEFIDENEAKLGGIINTTSKPKVHFKHGLQVTKNFDTADPKNGPSNINHNGHNSNNLQIRPLHTPSKNVDRAEPSNGPLDRYYVNNLEFREESRNDHVIPEGNDYFELFAQPWSVYHYEAENKAFYSIKTMHVEYDDIGFNVGLLQRRHEEIKVDDVSEIEAKENARKIISTYPVENRKRRRRF